MPKSDKEAVRLGESLLAALDTSKEKNAPKGKVDRYLKGDQDLPYSPNGAATEYRLLQKRSITNWLPLITDTFAKGLFVDGYRAAKSSTNAKAWTYWQANGLDARQAIAHRGALEHGVAHTLVLPGDPAPVIRPLSPLRTHALYSDPDSDYPEIGLVVDGLTASGDRLARLFDSSTVYNLVKPKDAEDWTCDTTDEHGLGVTPLVRFRNRLDGDATGIILPLTTLQDRVNEAVFSLLIAIQYASFRQRWATGLAIPTAPILDAEGVPTGEEAPIEPFKAAVDRLWISDSPETKFGDFAQTETSGHLAAYVSAVQSLAAIAQCPPHVLLGDLVNLSADALAAAEASTQRKTAEYETLFGESWEQTLRLAASAAGDSDGAVDMSAQVRWRDTEARSMAQTVDALGKMVQMLGVPAEAAWSRIPGVTDTDVEAWKAMRTEGDVFGALMADVTRQSTPNPQSTPTA